MMELKYEAYLLITKPGQLPVSKFKHISLINNNSPGIRPAKGSNNLQQSCFSCTTGTNDGNNFAFFNIKLNMFKYLKASIRFGYPLCKNHMGLIEI